MLKFPDFYRRFGVRKEEALKSFSYPKTKDFQLPRESVYHSLPTTESDRNIDPNDLMVAKHTGAFYAVHLFELASHEGNPVRITAMNPTVIIRDLEKQNRQFRRVRQTNVVYNNPTAMLIYNYSVLQNLYRYRPNFLNPWQKWYNVYSTMWQNVNQLAKESSRQHFIRFDIPSAIPPISQLVKAEGGMTRPLLEIFNNPQILQLLDLWKWAGGKPSAMDAVDRSSAERINLVFVEGDRVGVVNLFSLLQWRGLNEAENDEQAVEDEEFIRNLEAGVKRGAQETAPGNQAPVGKHSAAKLFQRKVLMFFVRLAKLREVVTAGATELEEPATTVAADQQEEATGQSPDISLFGDDDLGDDFETAPELQPVDVSRLSTQAPGQPEPVVTNTPAAPVAKDDPLDLFVPTDDDLLDDTLFVVKAPEPVTADSGTEETQDVNVLASPELGVQARAVELFERGVLSLAELKRFQKLAERYKEIPNPFNEAEETLEQLATITPEQLKFNPEACSIKPIEGIDDPSLFKSTLLEFRSKYIKDVLHRDVANAVMAVQRGGVAVTDYRVDRVIDAVNKYDEYSVRLVPVGGEPVTVRFTLPTIEEDGTWVADGARYMLRNQRGDAPIRKTSPSRVALSSYRNKLFIERSTKVAHDFDEWLQNQVIASNQSPEPTVTGISYRSGVFKVQSEKWPRLYTGLARRFTALETNTWHLSFEPTKIDEVFGTERAQWLAGQGLLPFGLSGNSVLAMDEAGAIYSVENKRIESFGDIGSLFNIDVSRAPLEVAEFKVGGKSIPVGVALCYLLGLDRVLKDCGSEPRRVRKGMRLNVGPDEFAVRFFDEALVFSRQDRKAALLFGGFRLFQQQTANYTLSEFNKPDVYLNVIEGRGLGMRQLNALTDLKLFFIDPITLDLLKELKEPETFTGLLYRATELLTHDAIPKAKDRIRGYERISAAVYRELTSAVSAWRRRPVTSKATIELNPNAVWMAIQTDPANGLVEDSNPINYLKELEAVTFGGTGGRSSRSMVRSTRQYDPDDFGVISEATKDSSDVAISTYLTPNPRLTGLRGVFDTADYEDFEMSSVLSTSALCAPFALNDDQQN